MTWRLERHDAPGVAIIATMLIVSGEQLTGGTSGSVDVAVKRAIEILHTSGDEVDKWIAAYPSDSSEDEDENDDE